MFYPRSISRFSIRVGSLNQSSRILGSKSESTPFRLNSPSQNYSALSGNFIQPHFYVNLYCVCMYMFVCICLCVIVVFLNWVRFDSYTHFESLDLELVHVNLEILIIFSSFSYMCVCFSF